MATVAPVTVPAVPLVGKADAQTIHRRSVVYSAHAGQPASGIAWGGGSAALVLFPLTTVQSLLRGSFLFAILPGCLVLFLKAD